MKRGFIWVLAVGFFCAHASAADRRYLELTTAEFTLVSGVSEARTREIAAQIDIFRAGFEQLLGMKVSSALPLRIYALPHDDWESFAQPRPGVAGYFVAQPFSSDLLFDADDRSAKSHELMLHEYTHYVLRVGWSGNLPPFLDEGLAEVFSNARVRDGALVIEPREDYVRYLRKREWLPFERLLSVRRRDEEYLNHSFASAFYAQSWATVFYTLATHRDFGARIRAYSNELEIGQPRVAATERLLGLSEAEANRDIAAFVRKQRALKLPRALEREMSGQPTGALPTEQPTVPATAEPTAPTTAQPTGAPPIEQAAVPAIPQPTAQLSVQRTGGLPTTWPVAPTTAQPAAQTSAQPTARPARQSEGEPFPPQPELSRLSLRTLSADDSTLALAELVLRLKDGHRKALPLFNEVLASAPRNPRAQLGAAWSHYLSGDLPAAATSFNAIAGQGGLDGANRVSLARGLFQIAAAASQTSDQLTPENRHRFETARALFNQALHSDPTDLEAINGYVLANVALGDHSDDLIDLAERGYDLAPRSAELAVGLAILHDRRGSKDTARVYWNDATKNSHTASTRAWIDRLSRN